MLRVEKRHEIEVPHLAGVGAQQFWIAEQVAASPLWHIRVLQITEDPTQKVWNTYLATHAGFAASLVAARPWDTVKVSVLLPSWMSESGEPVMAKCKSWWICSHPEHGQREYWLYETNLCSFVGSGGGIEPKDLTKVALFWQSDCVGIYLPETDIY